MRPVEPLKTDRQTAVTNILCENFQIFRKVISKSHSLAIGHSDSPLCVPPTLWPHIYTAWLSATPTDHCVYLPRSGHTFIQPGYRPLRQTTVCTSHALATHLYSLAIGHSDRPLCVPPTLWPHIYTAWLSATPTDHCVYLPRSGHTFIFIVSYELSRFTAFI